MADLIQLLPDSIANQIAAGEVVQRPASVVKELLENSIDAGSTEIKVIIKDAGKTLIQVMDNGCGMSETDARMCFERHATSKIRQAKDLFAIRTMGFRGEALASISAVAQLEMKTRRREDELGTLIRVEGSEVVVQEPCQCPPGTSFAVKNLFYNVPARRQFLKSDVAEMRHIVEEFQRVAIANSDLFFSLHHNRNEQFHLTPGNLRQRIVGVFGTHANKKLVPVSETTDILQLKGFVGNPAHAKKTRGEQYIYVNNRFIKSGYLNHAIVSAYEDLIPKDTFPLYVIFIDIDPARIDINVHPTKQEIKFDDERLVYNYLKVAVRHALGRHSMTPSLDFEQEPIITNSPAVTGSQNRKGGETGGSWNISSADLSGNRDEGASFESRREQTNLQQWESLYQGLEAFDQSSQEEEPLGEGAVTIASKWDEDESGEQEKRQLTEGGSETKLFQVHHSFIVSQIKSGFLLIDQQAAHERILFERYLRMMQEKESFSQKALFPKNINLSPADAALLKDLLPQVNALGFDVQEFGQNSFVIHGIPAEMVGKQDEQKLLETLLEQFKQNLEFNLDKNENIARAMAKSACVKRKQKLEEAELQELFDQLFACEVPFRSPSGRNCFISFDLEELEKRFRQM
jgi:DNA mismatch repair protein MutL